MKQIGIDFGTTNTTFAYYDEKTDRPEGYKFGNDKEYIPSAIAYRKRDGKILVAFDALSFRDDEGYYFYEFYKIDLIKNYNKIANANHKKTYLEITKDYIDTVIERYKSENNIDDMLDTIVLAVPNVVVKGADTELKKELEKHLKTKAKKIMLESEPSCACAYFHNFIGQKQKYEGNVIILDYGGGTLDVSICKISYENEESIPSITIVRQYAPSIRELINHGAGVSFYHELTKRVMNISENSDNFMHAVSEIEENFTKSGIINEYLSEYYNNNCDEIADESIRPNISGKKVEINCSTIVSVFNEKNKGSLNKALDEILGKENESLKKMDEKVKFLAVGGFSNLACVDNAIANRLSTCINGITKDERIVILPKRDRYFSVAYGAALYASKIVKKSKKSSIVIGVKSYNGIKYNEHVIIDENTTIDEPNKIVWNKTEFSISSNDYVEIKLFITSKDCIEPKEYDVDITSAVKRSNCVVNLGIQVTDNEYILYVRNVDDKKSNTVKISQYVSNFMINAGEKNDK